MPAASNTTTLPEAGTWDIDPAHSAVAATVRHLMISKVRGSFRSLDGTIHVGETPEESAVEVTIDAASIDTGVADRDAHLRSPDFLDVENHPAITFASTAVRAKGKGYEVDGELTIRGVTKPVALDLQYLGEMTDPWGNDKVAFAASTSIEREDWGLTWNQALESGGWLVGKAIDVDIEVQASRA